jgi:Ca2+-binding RTX toxin-like protein
VGTDDPQTLVGTAGRDVIVALNGEDVIDGLGGNDWICGGDGRDTITGNAGDDHVYGQAGGDTVVEGAGDDYDVAGAHGLYADVLTYEFVGQPLKMRLAANSAVVGDNRDTVDGFDSYAGTDHDDLFTGTDKSDGFQGGGGDDDIAGYGGNDYLVGDAGDDTILGGRGHDNVQGWQGFDHLIDMYGNNFVHDIAANGATGAVIMTGSGSDRVEAESPDPQADYTITTGNGADAAYVNGVMRSVRVDTGLGNDFVQVADGAETLRVWTRRGDDELVLLPTERQRASGGAGVDRVRFPLDYGDITLTLGPDGHLSVPVEMSLPGFESAWSGYGDDTITGSGDRNVIFSGDGDDNLWGLGGDDKLNASYDNNHSDMARGGAGHDQCIDAEIRFSCES